MKLSLFIIITGLSLSSFNIEAATLKIAVASNFAPTLKIITEKFTAQTGTRIKIIKVFGRLFISSNQ